MRTAVRKTEERLGDRIESTAEASREKSLSIVR